MFSVKHSGDFSKTKRFFKRASSKEYLSDLDTFGKRGVDALKSSTPIDSGKTADSWDYKIVKTRTTASIVWTNDNIAGTAPVAILIQYGHGTKNGGYVHGRDFINPSIQPIFDEIANDVWASYTK